MSCSKWGYTPEKCEGEVWKPIPGYEGLYEISNLGRIRRLTWKFVRGSDFGGYRRVNLIKNGEQKSFLVHRLVAEAFIPNENEYPFINHMDENPSNNSADNLEWCTPAHNVNWGTGNERRREHSPNRTAVISVDMKTGATERFKSIGEAFAKIVPNGKRTGSISEALNGKRKSAYGRYWFFDYSNQENENIPEEYDLEEVMEEVRSW
jgi:hypothetical protein